MKQIRKYILSDALGFEQLNQSFDIPKNAKIITAKMQHDKIVFWAIVDLDSPIVRRNIRLVLTGEKIDEWDSTMPEYISTVQFIGPLGEIVLHVFDDGEFY